MRGDYSVSFSAGLSRAAEAIGVTAMQVALVWLLHRAPNVMLIPGTSSVQHLGENIKAAQITLSDAVLAELDALG